MFFLSSLIAFLKILDLHHRQHNRPRRDVLSSAVSAFHRWISSLLITAQASCTVPGIAAWMLGYATLAICRNAQNCLLRLTGL